MSNVLSVTKSQIPYVYLAISRTLNIAISYSKARGKVLKDGAPVFNTSIRSPRLLTAYYV